MSQLIALDVDSVLVDFLPGWEEAVRLHLGWRKPRARMEWDLRQAYDLTAAEYAGAWAIMADHHIYRELPVLPGARAAVELLREKGYEIRAVTAIPSKFLDDRIDNLRQFGFRPDDIIATGDRRGGSKAAVLKELRPQVFVDDQLQYLTQADEVPTRVWIQTNEAQDGIYHHECYDVVTDSLLAFVLDWFAQPRGVMV